MRNTILFNTFVYCQLFNEINARRLGNEKNVFAHFFSNYIYLGIWFFTAGVQALLVNFGEQFAETKRLSWQLWLITLGIAFITLPWGFLLKLIPVPEEPAGTEEENRRTGKTAETTDERAPLLGSKQRSSSFDRFGNEERDLEAQTDGKKGWNTVRSKVMPRVKVVTALRRQRNPVAFNMTFSRSSSLSGSLSSSNRRTES